MKSNDLYLDCKDHSVSGENFQLLYQAKTDMLVTNPQPENLEQYYQSDDYISHTDSNKTIVDKVYQTVKIFNLKSKTNLIRRYSNDGTNLLDVGSGTGDFLMAAKKKGWKTIGVEPNTKARTKAKEKGVEVVSNVEMISNTKFDTITLWHVLEHLPNLEEQIKTLTGLLAENGTLIIAVPNYKSYDAKYYKSNWAAFDVPRHLWHFSKNSISALFEKHNFRVVKTKPMLFDAFYVSLLSEKYKSKKQNFIKAIYIGLKSNIYGWRTKEYSSHIYILKNASNVI
ncbi:class I SAM-dependent methyltransferase [Arenibacter certesii]|uniref:Methyltransferase n=1 Tax=Arenibacter certesii TaxID=228955 RepID=A0A918J1V3_9FLAO|nr:class I SAM-dependent methyltransferase [Arenibacter certesii]GGW43596.1 methyltransferase [Arenibacter certesii]